GINFTPTAAQAHASITVTVTADDGHGGSAIANSSAVTIANNNPAFADTPSISGTALVGSSLTAINTTITDIDGDTSTLSYQWQVDGVDIAGATGASFTPTAAQAHASISVTITGNDGHGGSTPAMTTSTVLVADSSPIFIATPTITGSAILGSSLAVTNTATTDADNDTVILTYLWQADGVNITGATGPTYSPTATEAHAAITVSVVANDGYGGITIANSAGVTVANNTPTFDTTPTISGAKVVGSTLSADTVISDLDGDTIVQTYQWQANGVDIAGANGQSYTLTSAEARDSITVAVVADDSYGGIAAASSTAITVLNSKPYFEATPAIMGTTDSGSTLSLMNTAATDVDGDSVNLSYQWQLNGVDIADATLETYEIQNSDRGGEISTVITADDGNGSTEIIITEKVAIPAASSGGSSSGAVSWLTGLMGLLLLAGRRLTSRSERRS
ncbi:MAG: hypothetical protein OQK69_06525, partial [Gammaproteobacteria bacterium]|nr:hypothetical protein [Gammaproteobacteria bacterium]